MKPLSVLVLAAGAALAAPAFAQNGDYVPVESVTTYRWDPATGTYLPRTTTYYDDVTVPATVIHEPAPVLTYGDPVIVTAPRATEDELITSEVVDRLASDPNLSGRIGVETERNTVTLTGRVGTRHQVDRAERHAASVDGVREVNNLLRSRVGNS